MGAQYRYSLTPAQVQTAVALGNRKLFAALAAGRGGWATAWINFLVWMGLTVAVLTLLDPLAPAQALGLLALLLGGLGVMVWLSKRTQAAAFHAMAEGVLAHSRDFHLEQDEDGLTVSHVQGSSRIAWRGIRALLDGPEMLILQLRGYGVLPIPLSAFPDEAALGAFREAVTRGLATVDGETPVVAPPEQASPAPLPDNVAAAGVGPDLAAHLRRGVRLLFLLPAQAPGPRAGWTSLILLALLSLVVPPLSSLLQSGFQGEFQTYQLPSALFHLPVFVLAAWALAALARQTERTLDLLLALVAMAIPLDALVGLGFALFPDWWEDSEIAYQLPNFWLALAAALAAGRMLGLPRRLGLAAVAVAVATVALPLTSIYRDRALWEAPESPEEQAANERRWNALVNEDSFYLQSRLLDRAMEQVRPGRPGVPELFFVGLAGDASQDVFMKEVRVVADLFRERFGTAGHSVTLINNPDSVGTSPIATATSLERTLNRMGQLMDRDEDILFLYLSSHGGEDHRLALDFWPLRTKPLHPANLRAMLDRAGIQRRVVVVSACYSGGYIDALKDEHTLVITAAAPDRRSFGCSDQADFTYFGKAYFDEALRQTRSFTEAFDIARVRIAERERAENSTPPSEPRMFLGEGLRGPLEELARGPGPQAGETPAAKDDRYDRLLALLGLDEMARAAQQACLKEVEGVGPEVLVARTPNYFGGVAPGHVAWPSLLAAWQRYADAVCVMGNDHALFRQAYRQAWQARLPGEEVESLSRWMGSPMGRRWLAMARGVDSVAVLDLTEARRQLLTDAMGRYQDEVEGLLRAQQKAQTRKGGT